MHERATRLGARLIALMVLVVVPGMSPVLAADAEHGKALYKACAACHTDKPGTIGPTLKGVVGRKSGALDDFRYSAAMKRAELVWDEATLRNYISDPQGTVKGNRMPFAGIKQPTDADDIVAYLKTLQ